MTTLRLSWPVALWPLISVFGWILLQWTELSSLQALTIATGVWMIGWWMSGRVPIWLTSLIPSFVFPIAGVLGASDLWDQYLNDVIFLFFGGLVLSRAIEVSGLHERLALRVLGICGDRTHAVLLGFIGATSLLTMWVSNTAAALIMLPLVEALVRRLKHQDGRFAKSLYLGVAYAASIGGVATLIGSPPNAVYAAFMKRQVGQDVGFLDWAVAGMPLAVTGAIVLWLYLSRLALRFPNEHQAEISQWLREGREKVAQQDDAADRYRTRVGIVFAGMVILWILRPALGVPWLNDSRIALGGALALLVAPRSEDWIAGPRLLAISELRHLTYSVLLLVGGGLALSQGVSEVGLVTLLADKLQSLQGLPPAVVLVLLVAMVVGATEFGSNTAIVSLFIPLTVAISSWSGLAIGELALAVAFAGSLSFMLPMATPPNAAVFARGHVSMATMARVGIGLNGLFIVLISFLIGLRALC